MRLTDLEPQFLRYEERVETWEVVDGDEATWRERGCPTKPVTGPRTYLPYVDNLYEAQAIHFLCPVCFRKNGGAVGTHWVEVSFADRGVLDYQGSHNDEGKPSRWTVSGTSYHDLTTTPSIFLKPPGCGWHGYITNGEVT